MARTSKTPPIGGGASRDSFAGLSRRLSTLEAYQAQFLGLAFSIQPDRAVMLAALAFGGGAHD